MRGEGRTKDQDDRSTDIQLELQIRELSLWARSKLTDQASWRWARKLTGKPPSSYIPGLRVRTSPRPTLYVLQNITLRGGKQDFSDPYGLFKSRPHYGGVYLLPVCGIEPCLYPVRLCLLFRNLRPPHFNFLCCHTKSI